MVSLLCGADSFRCPPRQGALYLYARNVGKTRHAQVVKNRRYSS